MQWDLTRPYEVGRPSFHAESQHGLPAGDELARIEGFVQSRYEQG